MKGNVKTNRVCVYVTGVNGEKVVKLLGIPDSPGGTGLDESELVVSLLKEWNVRGQVCGMVFDTTATNSGAESGACRFLEIWLEKPILWLACQHHVMEVHMSHAVKNIFGQSKDPGVSLFRRLKSEWHEVKEKIDYNNLETIDFSSLPGWMNTEASS